jgi:hypothetical protein
MLALLAFPSSAGAQATTDRTPGGSAAGWNKQLPSVTIVGNGFRMSLSVCGVKSKTC